MSEATASYELREYKGYGFYTSIFSMTGDQSGTHDQVLTPTPVKF
jgi:hypothetical protein